MHPNRISYLFYHLGFIYPDVKQLLSYMVFEDVALVAEHKHKIVFKMAPINKPTNIKQINKLDVLFPLSNREICFYFDEDENLIFEHDWLQGAFYLLSAQQETETTERDGFGRFSFKQSLQYKLGIPLKALVNEYFKILGDGLGEFAKRHDIRFRTVKPFDTFVFHLSHDIDRLFFHHPKEVAGRALQLLGLREREYSAKALIKMLWADLLHVWHYKNHDKWWNFRFLMQSSADLGFRSTFYFLPKTGHRLNSRYNLASDRMLVLYKTLEESGFEVGLHLPLYDNSYKYNDIDKISTAILQKQLGVRRHYLSLQYPDDYVADTHHGVLYDCSFGFHDQVGFRNSYCLPFKPYDHANEQMVELWVLPLTAMDVTFLYKQQKSFVEIETQMGFLATEAIKYGGFLSLLWHNCRFDEVAFPGISNFYRQLLSSLQEKKAHGITGRKVVEQMEQLCESDYSTFMYFFNKGLISNE